jgi:NADH-quinone oxidoreductase subunit E
LKGAKRNMLKNKKTIDEIISNYIGKKGSLIPLLQEIQNVEKYLAPDVMKYLSEKTGIKLADIYGVATFYTMFRLKPQGDHVIRICKGTACHVSEADGILQAVKNELKLKGEKDTTSDNKFTVMEVACLGCCSLAPVIMIDDNTYGKLTTDSIGKILKSY